MNTRNYLKRCVQVGVPNIARKPQLLYYYEASHIIVITALEGVSE